MIFLALAAPAPPPAAPPLAVPATPPVARTAPLPRPSGYRSMFVKWAPLAADARAAEAATRPAAGAPQTPAAAAAAALGDRVGEMVATGNCRGGEQMALDAGDLALARAVRDHCNAPVAQ